VYIRSLLHCYCYHVSSFVSMYRGNYCDGKLKEPVKPCAGNVGTQITVSSLTVLLIREIMIRVAHKKYGTGT